MESRNFANKTVDLVENACLCGWFFLLGVWGFFLDPLSFQALFFSDTFFPPPPCIAFDCLAFDCNFLIEAAGGGNVEGIFLGACCSPTY